MVNFELTDEQRMLQELARDFANEEIKPNASHWDKESIYPKEAIDKANELGLLIWCNLLKIWRRRNGFFLRKY